MKNFTAEDVLSASYLLDAYSQESDVSFEAQQSQAYYWTADNEKSFDFSLSAW